MQQAQSFFEEEFFNPKRYTGPDKLKVLISNDTNVQQRQFILPRIAM